MPTATHRRSRNSFTRGTRGAFSRTKPQRGRFQRSNRPRRPSGGNRPYQNKGRSSKKMPSFDPSRFINTNPVEAAPETYTPTHRFDTFGLDGRLVKNIGALGLKTPTPIQDQIIPEILNGRDVIGLAQTGTGKTAAFLLPLLERTLKDPRRQTLILAPTRELAIQIEAELHKLARGLRIYAVTCVGGMNINPQLKALRRPQHFVIGTPGRVIDLMKRRAFDPKRLTAVVLDEADRMLDMGFINDMRTILAATRSDRETLFFSATMTREAEKIVTDFLRDPITVSVKKKDAVNSIKQDVVRFEHASKLETLLALLSDADLNRVLIFGAMKHSVEQLAKKLSARGVRAESIHGNKNHGQRQRSLKRFKDGQARVLVATDVAARGIHVDNISHVINYDLPNTFEDYVHRIGRTGRADKRGKALTFVPA